MLSVTVLARPTVEAVTTTQLKKGQTKKGTSAITITFSEPLASSDGSSNSYSLVTPKVVRVRKKKTTELVPVGFRSRLIGTNLVSLNLTKPTKLHLILIVRGTISGSTGVTLGEDVTITVQ